MKRLDPIVVYTDGSCNPILGVGAWVALLFIDGTKCTLSGMEMDTTNQRMELSAAIHALEFIERTHRSHRRLQICTDSQYLVGLQRRKESLITKNMRSKAGRPIANEDLVRQLLDYLDQVDIQFTKVVAHRKIDSYNQEADQLARSMVRKCIRTLA